MLQKNQSMVDLKLPFPWKLHQLLEDAEKHGIVHIVSWLSDGKAFKVHKPKEFCDDIMTSYFSQTKYKSFTRQLYIYGFSKISSGPDAGAFFHPSFLRNNLESCLSLRRNQQEDRRKKRSFQKVVVKKEFAPSELSRSVKLPPPPAFLTKSAPVGNSKKALSLFQETFFPDSVGSDSLLEGLSAPDQILDLSGDPLFALDSTFSAPVTVEDDIFDLEPRPIEQMVGM